MPGAREVIGRHPRVLGIELLVLEGQARTPPSRLGKTGSEHAACGDRNVADESSVACDMAQDADAFKVHRTGMVSFQEKFRME